MEPTPPPSLAETIAAAQTWWREAGVDYTFADDPRSWLADENPVEAAPVQPERVPAPERPAIGGDRAAWPRDLESFAPWWLSAPGIGPEAGRVPPRGPAGAPLMILVPMPEADDRERLLAGAQGRLLENMLRAMGFASADVFVAAALPRHSPMPEWTELAADGLGMVLMHLVELAAPQRLLVLGRDVLPLLQHDPAQAAPPVSELSIQTGKLPLLASYAPGRLLDHPRLRSELWRQWLDWTGTEE